MSTTHTDPDPRVLMARLWELAGRNCPAILASIGVTEDNDPIRYSRLRRILSGILYGDAQEVRLLLDAMGYGPGDPVCDAYVLAYLRWSNAEELAVLAKKHGVIL